LAGRELWEQTRSEELKRATERYSFITFLCYRAMVKWWCKRPPGFGVIQSCWQPLHGATNIDWA